MLRWIAAEAKGYNLRRAATMSLGESLIQPSFDERNILDPFELASALSELASSAGLLKQKRWSVTLPGATTRTLILTLEAHPGSHSELEEVLAWKMDRGFSVPLDELRFRGRHFRRTRRDETAICVVATASRRT